MLELAKALSAHWVIIVCVYILISQYQRHVSGTQESSSRHHLPQLSPHVAREIGELKAGDVGMS